MNQIDYIAVRAAELADRPEEIAPDDFPDVFREALRRGGGADVREAVFALWGSALLRAHDEWEAGKRNVIVTSF